MSVVVPVFNRLESLKRAVKSVLKQGTVDLEVLVVDDASTVELSDAVGAFDDPRVRYIRRETNGGVAAAQNTGVEHARGEFIAFLHSDDEYVKDALKWQLEAIASTGDEVCAVQTGARFGTEDMSPILRGVDFEWLLASQVPNVHISPFLFRTRALRSEPFDNRLRAYEDYDLLLRLLPRFEFVFDTRVTTLIHADQEDRLSASTRTSLTAMQYLFDKYARELATRPRTRSVWNFKLSRLAALEGQDAVARRYLVRSVRDDPRRIPRLALLLGGPEGQTRVWRLYRRASSIFRRRIRPESENYT